MAAHTKIETRYIVAGKPVFINLIENPTIDDVVVTEARVYAASLDRRDPTLNDRRVSRDIRDFLIRIGVER